MAKKFQQKKLRLSGLKGKQLLRKIQRVTTNCEPLGLKGLAIAGSLQSNAVIVRTHITPAALHYRVDFFRWIQ